MPFNLFPLLPFQLWSNKQVLVTGQRDPFALGSLITKMCLSWTLLSSLVFFLSCLPKKILGNFQVLYCLYELVLLNERRQETETVLTLGLAALIEATVACIEDLSCNFSRAGAHPLPGCR